MYDPDGKWQKVKGDAVSSRAHWPRLHEQPIAMCNSHLELTGRPVRDGYAKCQRCVSLVREHIEAQIKELGR